MEHQSGRMSRRGARHLYISYRNEASNASASPARPRAMYRSTNLHVTSRTFRSAVNALPDSCEASLVRRFILASRYIELYPFPRACADYQAHQGKAKPEPGEYQEAAPHYRDSLVCVQSHHHAQQRKRFKTTESTGAEIDWKPRVQPAPVSSRSSAPLLALEVNPLFATEVPPESEGCSP
jgi:hypothetical protein